MKITVKELKRIIREEIVREAPYDRVTPSPVDDVFTVEEEDNVAEEVYLLMMQARSELRYLESGRDKTFKSGHTLKSAAQAIDAAMKDVSAFKTEERNI